jgi:hypothetical protein
MFSQTRRHKETGELGGDKTMEAAKQKIGGAKQKAVPLLLNYDVK